MKDCYNFNIFQEQERFCFNELNIIFVYKHIGKDVMPYSDGILCDRWVVKLINSKTHTKYNTKGCMYLDFYVGIGHEGKTPMPFDILYSLYFDNPNGESFENWCQEYGYDSDSRKAEKIYNTCIEQTNKFNTVFPNFKWPIEIIENW